MHVNGMLQKWGTGSGGEHEETKNGNQTDNWAQILERWL